MFLYNFKGTTVIAFGSVLIIANTHARKIFKNSIREEEYETKEESIDAVPNVPNDRDDVDPTRPY